MLARGGAGAWAAAEALLPILPSSRWRPSPRRPAPEDDGAPSAATAAAGGERSGYEGGLAHLIPTDRIAHTLTASHNVCEGGGGRGIPLVPDFLTGGGVAVRRLTPREYERLHSFPDDYTALLAIADRHRYRALGNSWPVNVARWIGAQIDRLARLEQ